MGNEDVSSVSDHYKVIIVGGGMAGITAANSFIKQNFSNFLLLEASHRLGGRIASIVAEPTDVIVELGANWIHGIDTNPIFKLARENNLLDSHYSGRGLGKKILFSTETGEPVHPRIVSDVDFLFGQLMSECEEFYKDQVPTPYDADSVGAYIEKEFDNRLSNYHGDDRKLRQMVLSQRLIGESVIVGTDSMREVSLSEAGCFENIPGVHFVIPPGFETIIKLLSRDIPNQNIRLNHLVTQISWDQSSGCGCLVECSNGSRFVAERCLVTLPLGYLKKYSTRLFHPQLPESKQAAINNIGMGTVNKIILIFDGTVFPEGIFRLEMIWHRESLEGEEEPEYLSSNRDVSKTWYKKIPFMEAVSQNVLVCWVSGKEAEYLETLQEDEVKDKMETILRGFLTRINPRLPKIIKVIKTNWKSNPLSLGAYCHIPVGTSAEAIPTLAEPLHNSHDEDVVFFAGEATHPTFYSSSHGAYLTGKKEADRILVAMNDD